MKIRPIVEPIARKEILQQLEMKENSAQRNICFIVPTLGNKTKSIDQQELLRRLFHSFVSSLTSLDTKQFFYTFYIGFDKGDPVFDDHDNLLKLDTIFTKLESKLPLSIHMIRVTDQEIAHHPARIWSGLANMAYWEGCEYLYQANDDLKIITKNWTLSFVEQLENNRLASNFGIVFPKDLNNPITSTQSFVHRTHLDLFGTFYPFVYKNWFSDNWIQLAYWPTETDFLMEDFHVENKKRNPRYTTDHSSFSFLNEDLKYSCERIADFLSSQETTSLSSFLDGKILKDPPLIETARIQALRGLIKDPHVEKGSMKERNAETIETLTERDRIPCAQIEMFFLQWGGGVKVNPFHKLLASFDTEMLEREKEYGEKSFQIWSNTLGKQRRKELSKKIQSIVKQSLFLKNQRESNLPFKDTIVVIFTNWDQMERTEKCIQSIRQWGIDNFVVFTLDKRSFDYLSTKNVHSFYHTTFGPQPLSDVIPGEIPDADKKSRVILELQVYQKDVLIIGNDVILKKNVFDFIDSPSHHIVTQNCASDPNSTLFCPDILFARRTAEVKRFFMDAVLATAIAPLSFEETLKQLFHDAFVHHVPTLFLPFGTLSD